MLPAPLPTVCCLPSPSVVCCPASCRSADFLDTTGLSAVESIHGVVLRALVLTVAALATLTQRAKFHRFCTNGCRRSTNFDRLAKCSAADVVSSHLVKWSQHAAHVHVSRQVLTRSLLVQQDVTFEERQPCIATTREVPALQAQQPSRDSRPHRRFVDVHQCCSPLPSAAVVCTRARLRGIAGSIAAFASCHHAPPPQKKTQN